eukprot:TRINITY_DN11880_c0_g1_i1.p1 TRINITY_DN11880_c0_g1~~TRINITY_DN11880_c0_g1_i1.p1  ORF type:complete len:449 (-),score=58.48 TRINITY_DN11880_c0_g1_i1:130-1476(-)
MPPVVSNAGVTARVQSPEYSRPSADGQESWGLASGLVPVSKTTSTGSRRRIVKSLSEPKLTPDEAVNDWDRVLLSTPKVDQEWARYLRPPPYSPRRSYPPELAFHPARLRPDSTYVPGVSSRPASSASRPWSGGSKRSKTVEKASQQAPTQQGPPGLASVVKMNPRVFAMLTPGQQRQVALAHEVRKNTTWKAERDGGMFVNILPWELGGCGLQSKPYPDQSRHNKFDRLMKSPTITLSPDCTSASWKGQRVGGWVMSEQKVKKRPCGHWFELLIEECDPTRWHDGLGVGICYHPDADRNLNLNERDVEGFACEILPHSWLLGYDGRAKFCGMSRYLHGSELRSQRSEPDAPSVSIWRPRDLRPGDVVAFLCTPVGDMLLFVNEQLIYHVRGVNIDYKSDVYAVVDLDGSTMSVHLKESAPSTKILGILTQLHAEDETRKKSSLGFHR